MRYFQEGSKGRGGLKANTSIPLIYQFFKFIRTLLIYLMSHAYLTQVKYECDSEDTKDTSAKSQIPPMDELTKGAVVPPPRACCRTCWLQAPQIGITLFPISPHRGHTPGSLAPEATTSRQEKTDKIMMSIKYWSVDGCGTDINERISISRILLYHTNFRIRNVLWWGLISVRKLSQIHKSHWNSWMV